MIKIIRYIFNNLTAILNFPKIMDDVKMLKRFFSKTYASKANK